MHLISMTPERVVPLLGNSRLLPAVKLATDRNSAGDLSGYTLLFGFLVVGALSLVEPGTVGIVIPRS